MTTLQEHLDDLDPAEPVRQFAIELSKRTAIESDRSHDYVSLRPSLSGAITVYAHRGRVSIALPPERAVKAAYQFPGATEEKKGPTTYLRLSEELLEQHAAAALNLAVEALAWKAAGPASTLGGQAKKPEKVAVTCPKHWYELSPSGACPICG
jgi:hypothetical protein